MHLGRNVSKRLRRDGLVTTADTAFRLVAEACREDREPRWLTDVLLGTLLALYDAGWAHSIEVWRDGDLVGGAMGIGLGGVLSGDSLFGRRPGAAAVAVADMRARLAEAGGSVIDAQWDTPFLRSLGAAPVGREDYLACSTARSSRCGCPRAGGWPRAAAARRVARRSRYIRSGSGTPSRPRPVVSTRSVAAHSASRDCRVSSSSALSTGHSS